MRAIGFVVMCGSSGVFIGSVADVTGDGSLGVGVGMFVFGLSWLLFFWNERL